MNLKSSKRPFIMAHRGYRAKYPENTLAAFNGAFDAGAQMIELDVRLTKDRKVVVIHDETLGRTTDGRGAVRRHTLSELKRLDAGSWFHPRFSGEPIPTLEEVLDQRKDQALINIEIKASEFEAHQPPDAIERQVAGLVRRGNARSAVLISSFDPKILENITAMPNALPVALISDEPSNQQTLQCCKQLKVFSWHPRFNVVSRQQVETMHEAGVFVFPYNVNSREEFQEALKMGADGAIIDDLRIAEEER